ncbi:sterol desaturase family protein, partial [Mesorhizobium sp. M7A.T.Ca.TU.009.01.1.1]
MEMASDIVYKVLDRISGAGLLATGLLLLTALVSALVAYWRTVEKKSWKEFFEFAVPHEVITHPSAKADLLFWVTRKALMPFLM